MRAHTKHTEVYSKNVGNTYYILHIRLSPTCFTLHSSPPHVTGANVRSCAVPSI